MVLEKSVFKSPKQNAHRYTGNWRLNVTEKRIRPFPMLKNPKTPSCYAENNVSDNDRIRKLPVRAMQEIQRK